MFLKRKKYISPYIGITIVFITIVMLILFPSCNSGKKDLGEAIQEGDSLPTMITYGVNSLVSDSGITRYRIEAEEWLMYTKRNPPFWSFEKGLYLEKFDSVFAVEAFIEADTAYYYERKKLWELRSNVFIHTQDGDQVNTDLLFWDQNTEKVYTNQYARIEQKGNIIDANFGFESNQELTDYRLFNNQGIFLVDETAKEDTTQTVSTEPQE